MSYNTWEKPAELSVSHQTFMEVIDLVICTYLSV